MQQQQAETYPKFADLASLHPSSKRALADMGLVTMTEIQSKTWEAASAGRDVLGRARTGTGKTIAFLLPAVQQLLESSNKQQQQAGSSAGVQVLILSPTRELASQIGEQAQQLTATTSFITTQIVFGGANSKPKDVSKFTRKVPTILVATPGRLRDHLQTTKVKGVPFPELVANTKILVLDETDRMLDMGFRAEVEDILSYLPKNHQRQTLLFSATVPAELRAVMAKTMHKDYVTVDCIHDTDPASHTNDQVQQSHIIVSSTTRLVQSTVEVILRIIESAKANNDVLKLVVFFPTANLVAFYAELFNDGLGIAVLELHSRKSQSFRTKTSDRFRESESAILFTSDVSARGLDYPGVTNVVQIGIPDSRESYIHRLGRTGRAGKVGEGVLVLTELEEDFLNKLNGLDIPVNQTLQTMVDSPPSPSVVSALNPILSSIRNGDNKDLANSMRSAYRSMLGFYNGKLKKLGGHNTDVMVAFCNNFAMQAGAPAIPEIERKTVRKMGLDGAPGLNIVKNAPQQQGSRNGGGGPGGGGGRGQQRNSNNNAFSGGRELRSSSFGEREGAPNGGGARRNKDPPKRNLSAGRGIGGPDTHYTKKPKPDLDRNENASGNPGPKAQGGGQRRGRGGPSQRNRRGGRGHSEAA